MILTEHKVLHPGVVEEPGLGVQLHTDSPLVVAEVDGRRNDLDNGTVLLGGPWSEYATRPDSIDRYRAIANEMGARVLAIDTPGFGDNSRRLPTYQRKAVRQGDFRSIADEQWEALESVGIEDRFTMIGYSMGANIIAALARSAPEKHHIDKMVLWESVSQKQTLRSLGKKFASENKDWPGYQKESPEWAEQPALTLSGAMRIARRPGSHINFPVGMAKANLFDDLRQARTNETIDENSQIIIASGSESRISSAADNEHLAQAVNKLGVQSVRRIIFTDESHGMIDSMPRFVGALKYMYT